MMALLVGAGAATLPAGGGDPEGPATGESVVPTVGARLRVSGGGSRSVSCESRAAGAAFNGVSAALRSWDGCSGPVWPPLVKECGGIPWTLAAGDGLDAGDSPSCSVKSAVDDSG